MCVADFSDLRVIQLMGAKPGQGPVQLEQLQTVAAQPAAHQEGREARREEEQRTDVSLQWTQMFQLWWTEAFPGVSRIFLLTI